MNTVIELNEQLTGLQSKATDFLGSMPTKKMPNGETAPAMTSGQIAELKAMNDEMSAIREQIETIHSFNENLAFKALDNNPVNRPGTHSPFQVKSLSDRVFEAKGDNVRVGEVDLGLSWGEAKNFAKGLESKATMTTSANGYPPEVLRDGSVVAAISRPPQLIDFLTVEPTDQNGIKFMAQTVRTDTSAPKAEAAAFDEATLTWAEQTDVIRKMGVFIPVTEEELEDEPGLRSLIDDDLRLMVRQLLDSQVTVGSGSGQNLTGIYNAASAQTQAKGADSIIDQIMKGRTKVRVTGRANPNLVVLHSNDFQRLALTKTSDGQYLLGNPMDAPVLRIWGLTVALSEALTEGTGMVLDTSYFRVKMRKDITVAISSDYSDFFVKNILCVRAHGRFGLKKMRGQAVCTLTGMNA